MNRKDQVRNIEILVRLNGPEYKLFQEQLISANSMKRTDFIRMMITQGYVKAPVHITNRMDVREFHRLLLEYRTHFKRISNLIKNNDPSLNREVETLVNSIQLIINKIV